MNGTTYTYPYLPATAQLVPAPAPAPEFISVIEDVVERGRMIALRRSLVLSLALLVIGLAAQRLGFSLTGGSLIVAAIVLGLAALSQYVIERQVPRLV